MRRLIYTFCFGYNDTNGAWVLQSTGTSIALQILDAIYPIPTLILLVLRKGVSDELWGDTDWGAMGCCHHFQRGRWLANGVEVGSSSASVFAGSCRLSRLRAIILEDSVTSRIV